MTPDTALRFPEAAECTTCQLHTLVAVSQPYNNLLDNFILEVGFKCINKSNYLPIVPINFSQIWLKRSSLIIFSEKDGIRATMKKN